MKIFSLLTALEAPREIGLRVQLGRRVTEASDQEREQLGRLLAKHGVINLVQQPLSPKELFQFVARWGEVITLPPGLALSNPEPGFPSITRVGNMRPDGTIIPSMKFAEYWHHDGDFWMPGENFIVNFLSCVHVPERGGNTGFLDTRLAYQLLGEAERTKYAHAHIWVRASEISDFKKAAAHELPPDACHPVCLPHPFTQEPALYLPDSRTGIQAADETEICRVDPLVESIVQRLGFYEHTWTPGDLVLMDNLQVMHRGMGGYGDSPRLLYRCQARLRAEG